MKKHLNVVLHTGFKIVSAYLIILWWFLNHVVVYRDFMPFYVFTCSFVDTFKDSFLFKSKCVNRLYIVIRGRKICLKQQKTPPWPIESIKLNNPLFRKQAKVNFHAPCSVSIQKSISSQFSCAAQSTGKDVQFQFRVGAHRLDQAHCHVKMCLFHSGGRWFWLFIPCC